jgi:hypothetical protein
MKSKAFDALRPVKLVETSAPNPILSAGSPKGEEREMSLIFVQNCLFDLIENNRLSSQISIQVLVTEIGHAFARRGRFLSSLAGIVVRGRVLPHRKVPGRRLTSFVAQFEPRRVPLHQQCFLRRTSTMPLLQSR